MWVVAVVEVVEVVAAAVVVAPLRFFRSWEEKSVTGGKKMKEKKGRRLYKGKVSERERERENKIRYRHEIIIIIT